MRLAILLGVALWIAGCAVRHESPDGITIEHDAYQPELAAVLAHRLGDLEIHLVVGLVSRCERVSARVALVSSGVVCRIINGLTTQGSPISFTAFVNSSKVVA
jgi:hypothetical protein